MNHHGRLDRGVQLITKPPRMMVPSARLQHSSHTDFPTGIAAPGRAPHLLHRLSIAVTVLVLAAAPVFAVRWLEPRAGTAYRTPIGGVLTVGLPGGFEITLNTDSEVHVALRPRVSRLTLDRGEAYLQVASDAERPLILIVDEHRIRALGTKFAVRRVGNELRVIVSEGKVQIKQHSDPRSASGVSLSAGTVARVEQTSIALTHPSSTEIEDLLSWRTGDPALRSATASDAPPELSLQPGANDMMFADLPDWLLQK
jgi:transmembrane sensor